MSQHRGDTQPLMRRLGYSFRSPELLLQAITHRSANSEHNERLEFLGDAVLGMVIGEALFRKFPKVPEGKLTRMRASLVKGETLALIAQDIGLGEMIRLGPGELKSGGQRRSSILADAMEATIGALYLDAGLEMTHSMILRFWQSRIDNLDPNAHPKDSKTRLQEYLQARRLPLPTYKVVSITGEEHAQTFTVECLTSLLPDPVVASANSRRKAEQRAALGIIEKLEIHE